MKLLFNNKPLFTEVDPYKLLINVGCLADIPTGKYVRGQKGENILNGGLSVITAVVGRGNTFKSTIMHYLMLAAASHMSASGVMTYINTYDTEMNIDRERLLAFSRRFPEFKDIDIHKLGIWSVTDKTLHMGDEWHKIFKEFLKNDKIKNKKSYLLETPMIDNEGKPIFAIFPTFGEIDSLSEFETSDIEEIQDKNLLGESGGNMIHARSGLAKTRLLMELPGLCNAAGHYKLMAAHVGQEMMMQQGPMSAPPPKKLQHMKQGEKIKGVTDKFFFLTTAVWQTLSATALLNDGTKGPEYPRKQGLNDEGSSDLNIVKIKMLRSKFGLSGFTLDIVVSQTEGVLPSLTEFHFIKANKRFGLEGNLQNYNLVLYPSVKLMRTTVREKIDSDARLRRAIKITADLLQLKLFSTSLNIEIPSPEDLYKKIGEKYNWDTLLDTRDFWTFNHYEHPIPYLSTMDLIEMYHGLYHPYWYKGETK